MASDGIECSIAVDVVIDPSSKTYEELEALCSSIQEKSRYDCDVEITDFDGYDPECGEDEQVDESDRTAVLTISCTWTEWYDVYVGSNSYDDYNELDYNEDCGSEMADYLQGVVQKVVEGTGCSVISCDFECDAPTYDELYEDAANSGRFDEDYDRDYWDDLNRDAQREMDL